MTEQKKKKSSRIVVGSIVKPKEEMNKNGKKNYNYLRLRGETLDDFITYLQNANREQGVIINLESKARQLQSLEDAVASGKLSADFGDVVRERIEKIPDFVVAELVVDVSKS